MNQNIKNSYWKKILGFRDIQEKLENTISVMQKTTKAFLRESNKYTLLIFLSALQCYPLHFKCIQLVNLDFSFLSL